MEHLLSTLSNRHISSPICVPCIADEFEGCDFHTLPDRKGWDVSTWKWENDDKGFDQNGKSIPEMAAFLQTWLFFGVLQTVLKVNWPHIEFTRYSTLGEKFLTTAALPDHILRWKQRLEEMPGIERDGDLDVAFQCLAESKVVCENLIYHINYGEIEENTAVLAATIFAVHLLCLTLDDIRYTLRFSKMRVGHATGDVFLKGSLLGAGWCPATVDYMQDSLPLSLQCVALAIGSERTKDDHGQCSSTGCNLSRVGPNYHLKHTRPECHCSEVKVPVDEVVAMLEEGLIPIVGIVERTEAQMERELRVHGVSYDDPDVEKYWAPYGTYPRCIVPGLEDHRCTIVLRTRTHAADFSPVAVSHIWSDGFGNPHDNAILSCQLDRLADILRNLKGTAAFTASEAFGMPEAADGSVPFWLDTLCIPVQPQHQSLRDFSIANMNRIYNKAAGVIVLDKDLSSLDGSTTFLEVTVRVLCSAWRSRLWTYQEGQVNLSLHLPTQGTCFSLSYDELFPEDEEADMNLLGSQLHYTAAMCYEHLITDALARGPTNPDRPEWKFTSIVKAACHRSTSREGDETVCIATFLGLDPSPLLKLPLDERMPTLLSMVPALANCILFTRGPRLRRPGFRWAPRSFLTPFGIRDLSKAYQTPRWYDEGFDGWYASTDDRSPTSLRVPLPYFDPSVPGLNVFFPGIYFGGIMPDTSDVITVRTQSGDVYLVERVDSGTEIPWPTQEGRYSEQFAMLLSDLNYGSLCLLVQLEDECYGQSVARGSRWLWRSLVMVNRVGDFVEDGSLDKGMQHCYDGQYVPFRWWVLV